MAIYEVPEYGEFEFPDDTPPDQAMRWIRSKIDSGEISPIQAPQQQTQLPQSAGGQGMQVTLGTPEQYQKIQGMAPPQEEDDSSFMQRMGEYAEPALEKLNEYAKPIVESPVAQFALGAGDQFNNFFRNLSNLVTPSETFPQLKSPMVQHGDPSTISYQLGEMAGDVGTFGIGAGAAKGGLLAAEYLPKLGPVASKILGRAAPGVSGEPLSATGVSALSEALGGGAGVARRAAGSGAYGAIQSPEGRQQGATGMMTASALVDALTGVGSKLMPRNLMRGTFSPDHILENLRAAKGTETPLGNIVGSPIMQRTSENILPKVPFSGATEAQGRTADIVQGRGQKLVTQYAHGLPDEEVGRKLGENIIDTYQKQKAIKKELYQKTFDPIDKSGYKFNPSEFFNKAKGNLKAISSTSLLKYEPGVQPIINKLEKYTKAGGSKDGYSDATFAIKESINDLEKAVAKNPKDEFLRDALDEQRNLWKKSNKTKFSKRGAGKDTLSPDAFMSLGEANLLKSSLRRAAEKLNRSFIPEDQGKATLFYNLSNALNKDFKEEVAKVTEKKLFPGFQENLEAANKNYESVFSKNLDKQINDFTKGIKPPEDLTEAFIRTGTATDKASRIDKIMDVLPAKDQDLFKYEYLRRALNRKGEVDPSKLATAVGSNKLGNRQFEALFKSPEERAKIIDYENVTRMNKDGIFRMLNLKNGQRVADYAISVGTSLTPIVIGLLGNGLLGGAVAAAISVGGHALLNKVLTSEKVRESLVKAIVKDSLEGGGVKFENTKNILTPLIGDLIHKQVESSKI